MEQRLIPWRSKPGLEIMELIEIAQELKLYLVQESGPTSFVFKDDEGEQFQVSVGKEIKCSCTPNQKDHCVHSIYMMLKQFRIDRANPIIWQGSYIDNELADLLAGKYAAKKNGTSEQHSYLQARSKNQIGGQVSQPPPSNDEKYFRLPIDEQTICPICQEEINQDQPTTFCRRKCGNNFHIHCIQVWIEHQRQSDDVATCPMCRTDMGTRAMEEMNRDLQQFNNRFKMHKGKKCLGCGKSPIVGAIYHCMYCENSDLCNHCFDGWQHLEHDKYLTREKSDDEWVPTFDRQNQYQQTQRDRLFGIPGSKNQFPLGGEQQVQLLNDFLLSCFPLMRDFQTLNELSIIGVDVQKNQNLCCFCGKSDVNVRRLFCGHGIDEKCLIFLIKEGQKLGHGPLQCPVDGTTILKGWMSLKNSLGNQAEEQKDINDQSKPTSKRNRNGEGKRSESLNKKSEQKKTLLEKEANDDAAINLHLNIIRLDNNMSTQQKVGQKKQLKPITGLTKYANIQNSINREIYGNINNLGADLNLQDLLICQPKENTLISNNFQKPPLGIAPLGNKPSIKSKQLLSSRSPVQTPTENEINFDGTIVAAVCRISSRDPKPIQKKTYPEEIKQQWNIDNSNKVMSNIRDIPPIQEEEDSELESTNGVFSHHTEDIGDFRHRSTYDKEQMSYSRGKILHGGENLVTRIFLLKNGERASANNPHFRIKKTSSLPSKNKMKPIDGEANRRENLQHQDKIKKIKNDQFSITGESVMKNMSRQTTIEEKSIHGIENKENENSNLDSRNNFYQ